MFKRRSTSPPKSGTTVVERHRLIAIVAGMVLLFGMAVAPAAVPVNANANATTATRGSATEKLLSLGPEGHALTKRAGVWDATFTSWDKPGAAPVTVTGLVAERRMIGPMLQEILHTVPGASGQPFTRVDDVTFNRLEGRWEYMSMDTRAPDGLMSAWSLGRDPEKRIFISFQPFATPVKEESVTGQFLRMEEIIIRSDANHDRKYQYFIPANGVGKKWLAIRYSYTRRPSS